MIWLNLALNLNRYRWHPRGALVIMITFAVVQVQAYKVETPQEAAETIQAFAPLFPGMPVVVMAIGKEAGPTYWGRDDLANFMAGIHPSSVEWRSYGFAGT